MFTDSITPVASLAPNSTLLSSNNKEQALIDQWISVADTEISAYVALTYQLCSGYIPYNKPVRYFWRSTVCSYSVLFRCT